MVAKLLKRREENHVASESDNRLVWPSCPCVLYVNRNRQECGMYLSWNWNTFLWFLIDPTRLSAMVDQVSFVPNFDFQLISRLIHVLFLNNLIINHEQGLFIHFYSTYIPILLKNEKLGWIDQMNKWKVADLQSIIIVHYHCLSLQ